MRIWHFLLIFFFFQCGSKQPIAESKHKIKLLILSGKNNHEWQKTTPLLLKMYEESGLFEVQVSENPDSLNYEDLQSFDAVVSNYTPWPEHDYRWPEAAETGLIKFVEEGGGFVVIHAASAAFYSWQDYQNMVGTTWGDSTAHGRISTHKVVITDNQHPITRQIQDFWITDELWVNAQVNSELNVLAESYSDPKNKGRGLMEPVIHWSQWGKGRVFHNVLGHNERAMKNTGWKTLMMRGTEWAATGDATFAIPSSLDVSVNGNVGDLHLSETDTSIALLQKDKIVWQYNYNTIKGKPFFHPLNINNATITWLSPEDHPWHLGIWHSWKFINGVNYWEYDRAEGVAPFNFLGVTEVRDIKVKKGKDYSCVIELDIFYHEPGKPDVMEEKRTVIVSPPDSEGLFFIDYKMDLTALVKTVELNRTPLPDEEYGKSFGGYAGLSVRFSQDMFDPEFLSSTGSTSPEHGNSSAWKYVGLSNIKGDRVGVAIFSDGENLNHPEPWYMTFDENHPFYYFSPAPIFYEPHIMEEGEELKFKYRMKFYTGSASAEIMERDYRQYSNDR